VTVVAPPLALRSQTRQAIERAWARAVDSGALPAIPDGVAAPSVEVARPANPEHGDLASNLALKLAKPLGRSPIAIAEAIAAQLTDEAHAAGRDAAVHEASVARPGFINLRLRTEAIERLVDGVLADPAGWGRVAPIRPRKVNVEFVSANPTGPLTIGNARGAFIGDLLSRVLEAGGQQVTREYYFNDAGGQIDNLGASVLAIRRGEPVPEDGYHGAYVDDLAAAVPDEVWVEATSDGADAAAVLGHWAAGHVRAGIEASLARLGVTFDVWKSEGSLHAEGWVDRAVERLREHGHVYDQDGALWFRSTAFGDDKDRVIRRSNGQPTYFAADIGYVTEKFSRGFDHLIYIWGADHHGTVARVRNAARAMGYDVDAVQMLLYSWVRFVRPWTPADGEIAGDGDDPPRTDAGEQVLTIGDRRMVLVSMSKRAGTFITLDELLEEIGVDAARWSFASRAATSSIDFDIELAKKQSAENPVYYVQYAHARIASILRKAAEAGLEPAPTVAGALGGQPEAALARELVRLPEVVEDAVLAEETVGVTAFATELATAFHAFYRDARVVDASELERSRARLALALATMTTIANALALLGISAPESM
jgi:arginyl-tRNA synthetase